MMRGKPQTNHRKYHQPCDFGVPFWSHLLDGFRTFCNLFPGWFSKPSRATSKGVCGCENGAKGCQKETNMEPKRVPNDAKRTPHPQSIHASPFYCFNKPVQVLNLSSLKKWVGEATEGITIACHILFNITLLLLCYNLDSFCQFLYCLAGFCYCADRRRRPQTSLLMTPLMQYLSG